MTILKIILWIMLAVVLLVLLTLCLPVRVNIKYDDSVSVKIKYLFLSFKVVPPPEKKNKSKRKNKKKKNKKTSQQNKKSTPKKKKQNQTWKQIKDLYDQKGLDGFLTFITELAKLAGGSLKNLSAHTVFKRFDANIIVATGDAADTAVKYGYVCAAVYPAVSLVLNAVKYKDYKIDITTDFDKKEPVIDFEAEASVILWFVAAEAVRALVKLVKLKTKGVI